MGLEAWLTAIASEYGIIYGVALVGVMVIGFVVVLSIYNRKPSVPMSSSRPTAPPAPVEIARIDELTAFTGGGVVALVLLVLASFVALFIIVLSTTVFGQIMGLLFWTANAIVWCAAMTIGRKRVYVVYRTLPRDEPR